MHLETKFMKYTQLDFTSIFVTFDNSFSITWAAIASTVLQLLETNAPAFRNEDSLASTTHLQAADNRANLNYILESSYDSRVIPSVLQQLFNIIVHKNISR
jgi:hypothetical protein